MTVFDFVVDEDFKTSLERDYTEMQACFDAQAYKSTHVLAGSIIEAVLIDYMISDEILDREKGLQLDFGAAIKLSHDSKIITDRTRDLCSVIKGYRNLIHPGRSIRLGEMTTKESANVAVSLVGMVISDVRKKRQERYGYTAEQIVFKVQDDPSALSILADLLKKCSQAQLEKIMLKVLPQKWLDIVEVDTTTPHTIPAYQECFYLAFSFGSESTKKKVANQFVRAINEFGGNDLLAYGMLYFRPEFMNYMSKEDRNVVLKYMLNRKPEDITKTTLMNYVGIGLYLDTPERINEFVDLFIRMIVRMQSDIAADARRLFMIEVLTFEEAKYDFFQTRIYAWIKDNERRQNDLISKVLRTLLEDIAGQWIPF